MEKLPASEAAPSASATASAVPNFRDLYFRGFASAAPPSS